ncbi:MAG: ABC transporter ATP-binding protein [Phycisphaeraceae bacterium]
MADDAILNEQLPTRLNLALWRKILVFARPYYKLLALLVTLGICVATADTLLPLLIRYVIDTAVATAASDAASSMRPLWLAGFGFLAIITVLAGSVFIFIGVAGRISNGLSHDIRRACFARLQELSFSFYDHHATGWLMARLTSDCDRLSRVLGWALLDITWGTCLVGGVAVMMLIIDWPTALAILAVVPVLLAVSAFFQRRILLSSRDMRRINSHLTAEFNEAMSGMKTTKTLTREPDNFTDFTAHSGGMYHASMRNAMQTAIFLPLVLVLVTLGESMALGVGGSRAIAGAITVGTLASFLYYAKLLPDPIREVARMLTEALAAQAAAERVFTLLETRPEIQDRPHVAAAIASHTQSDKAGDPTLAPDGMLNRLGVIEFRHVSFAYQDGTRVLDDFNLTVQPGQTIALVGPTGGGKSTIVNLLCRFYEPTAGHILFDGVDYRDRSLGWLQSNLGIVLQSPQLFSGPVRENIRYGRLSATDDDVIAAAKIVDAHRFITGLDAGYDTDVGQGGNRLSAGQKQLIAFARAVLAEPQLFVMDEATASVDTETEQTIQSAMHHVLHGRTSFVIAHRLSTIRAADRILVIEAGHIAEAGNHHELLAKRGHYFDLYTNQFTREHTHTILNRPSQ